MLCNQRFYSRQFSATNDIWARIFANLGFSDDAKWPFSQLQIFVHTVSCRIFSLKVHLTHKIEDGKADILCIAVFYDNSRFGMKTCQKLKDNHTLCLVLVCILPTPKRSLSIYMLPQKYYSSSIGPCNLHCEKCTCSWTASPHLLCHIRRDTRVINHQNWEVYMTRHGG